MIPNDQENIKIFTFVNGRQIYLRTWSKKVIEQLWLYLISFVICSGSIVSAIHLFIESYLHWIFEHFLTEDNNTYQ